MRKSSHNDEYLFPPRRENILIAVSTFPDDLQPNLYYLTTYKRFIYELIVALHSLNPPVNQQPFIHNVIHYKKITMSRLFA